ncbi:MAG: insulinase family protein [Verrucomicrobiales bacterium]|nr:insulinase family protein [Verrucomicrobiales bacterium]
MSARNRIVSLLAGLALICTGSLLSHGRPLPSDPRNLTNKLDNGVTWIYRQHNNPPGKMTLEMHVRTGSLNEKDTQRGLAHFLEHMAFNGSENFPPGKLIPYFESIGMQLGPDLNAFTSFDQTVYLLFTPNPDIPQIDKALNVLSDYAFRLTLPPEEIDKERGVVLEEERRGQGAAQRIRDKLWPELFSGSRFAERLPIGKAEIISRASREEFVEYYRAFYRPDNVTVVLVGDAPPENAAPLIKRWFGEYKPGAPSREPKGPEFKAFTEERGIVVTDPEMARCQIQMMNILPGRPPVTTSEQARRELVEELGSWIVNRRYDDRVKSGEASYRGAAAGVSDFFHDAELVSASATGEPKDWSKMIEDLIAEVKRGREHGFTERELKLAKSEMLSSAERAVRTEPTRNARDIAGEIINAVNDREPVPSAQQNLDLYHELLPGIRLSEVNTAFKDNFLPGKFAHVVTMSSKEPNVPSRDEVLAKARAAWARAVEAPKQGDVLDTLLTRLPTPGKVVESTEDKDLGITSAWLENGARVHHRFMDYKKDSVFVSISLAGGSIEETAQNAGVTEVATLAVDEAATPRFSSAQIRDFMTGKNIGVSASNADDNFAITVAGSPVDLEVGLQLAHVLLTDGKIEEAAFKNWKLSTLQRLEQRERLPHFKAIEALEHLLSHDDPRRVPFGKANVEALSREAGQAWFDRLRAQAPIEVAIVGDIQLTNVIPLMERYVGSLSKRPRTADHLKALRRSPRPPGPLAREVEVQTVTPQAMAIAGFAGADGRNTFEARGLGLAQTIATTRLRQRIREDLALVYSIGAQHEPGWVYEDSGKFQSGATCAPANAEKVIEEANKIFQAMAESGPTDEELANAKRHVANVLDTELREPSRWFSILRNFDLRGRSLAPEKTIREDYASYTAEQVRDVFRKYFTPARSYRVLALPAGGDQK